MGCFSNSPPAAPSYGATTANTLQSQIDLAPQQYQAEANPAYGQPAYAALALQNLNTLLSGQQAGQQQYQQNITVDKSGWYNPTTGQFLSPGQATPAKKGFLSHLPGFDRMPQPPGVGNIPGISN